MLTSAPSLPSPFEAAEASWLLLGLGQAAGVPRWSDPHLLPTLAQVVLRRLAYPHPDDIELHEKQHPVQDHQQPGEAEAQLREANGVVVELDKLDGLGDEGQGPVDEQG